MLSVCLGGERSKESRTRHGALGKHGVLERLAFLPLCEHLAGTEYSARLTGEETVHSFHVL